MTTLSTVTSSSRSVSIKAIDFRISSDIRDLEYRISIGEQILCVSHSELVNIAEISISYLKSTELRVSLESANELIAHITKFVDTESKTQELVKNTRKGVSHDDRSISRR